MKPMKKALSLLLLAAMLLTLLPVFALAAEQTGSITYSYVVPGAAFRLYLVGKAENGTITLTGDFAEDPVDPESDGAAMTLAGFAFRDGRTPAAEAVTDDNGTVRFENLPEGVYLLVGQRAVTEKYTYTPQPVLLVLPTTLDGSPVWDIRVNGKYDQTENQEKTSVSVLKIWEDDENTDARPNEILVQLLRDGQVFDTVKLNRENNWNHTWTELDGTRDWTVVEQTVPDGYRVSISGNGTGFVVTNTYTGPKEPEKPHLPQTGQLWWPVGLLAVAGLVLIVVGLIRRRGGEDYEQ